MEEPRGKSRIFFIGEGGGGGPNCGLERTVELLLRQIISPPPPRPPVAVARYTSLTPYHAVAVGAGNSASRAEANRSSKRYPTTIELLNIPGI